MSETPPGAATPPVLLVVDDDASVRRSLARLLRAAGYTVETFDSASALLAREPLSSPGCLILDVRLEDSSGLDLRAMLRAAGKEKATIFVTGHGDVPTSVRAMKEGASSGN